MKTIHMRLGKAAQTLCRQDVGNRNILWTSVEGYQELLDGEIQGLQACPECQAEILQKQQQHAAQQGV